MPTTKSTSTRVITTTTDPETGVTTQIQELTTPRSRTVKTVTTTVDPTTGVTTQVQEEITEVQTPEPEPPKGKPGRQPPNRSTRR